MSSPIVLDHPEMAFDFPSHGIAVPNLGSRAERILTALREEPGLAEREADWLGLPETLPELTREDFLRVHDAPYTDAFLSDDPQRVGPAMAVCYELYDDKGQPNRYTPETATLPLTSLRDKSLANARGTLLAARTALASEHRIAMVLGGGMHHAMRAGGRGFCPINDICLAIATLRAEERIRKAWVVDLDAHRGDGTAEIALTDPLTATLSIHMAHGWPLDAEILDASGALIRARYPSDVDLPIPAKAEATYAPVLERGLELMAALPEAAGPDIALVVGGADPYEADELPSSQGLQLSLDQMLERDRLVYSFLAERSIPQAWVLAGGYGLHAHEPPATFLRWLLPRLLDM